MVTTISRPGGPKIPSEALRWQSGSWRRRRQSSEDPLKLVERSLELRGPEGLGAKPRPELVGPVLASTRATLVDAVRMGFLRSSRTRGRVPRSIRQAADVQYLGHTGGVGDSTILRFEVPEFGEVAPGLFEQSGFWGTGPRPNETAFDLVAASLHDVRRMARDSERFDHNLLHRFCRYRQILRRGLDSIALPDAVTSRGETIDEELSAAAESLYAETPPTRRVRLTGRLDLLTVGRRLLGLLLEDGTRVAAVWVAQQSFVDLASLLDRPVLIEGLAEYRPSGTLLRIDADAIREAHAGDSVFASLPPAERIRDYKRETARVRSGEHPYDSIFGLVPDEASNRESDEEFARAVEALS